MEADFKDPHSHTHTYKTGETHPGINGMVVEFVNVSPNNIDFGIKNVINGGRGVEYKLDLRSKILAVYVGTLRGQQQWATFEGFRLIN